ncbi:MAG: glutamate 5-kinase [Alphaproteobacteria bacterium CG11_big_fil_rev_8_21_14_0_20_39_49]|nr:MAG: glutamate 5-kinase [Alphaproteobacteria bacterium CG11_big_fil_rev_8_21_14_0_20_39_49]
MELKNAKRVVIKIGSSLLIDKKQSGIRHKWLKSLVDDVVDLRKRNIDVVLVTSGAVALGKKYIKFKKAVLTLEEKQAAAACGQTDLSRNYQRYFNDKKIQTAQLLLTIFDSENRRNYLNAKNTIETLLENKVLPIINENDTVATHGLRFGDNDRLAARVSQMVGANYLILFSDIDGLYTANPNIDESAVHIEEVDEIDERIEAMAGGSSSTVGSGGMVTKIAAAKIAMMCGCNMILAKGFDMNPVKKLFEGGRHTLFISKENPLNARKRWIASSLSPSGEIIIDAGAARALQAGKSLLPAGVIDVLGEFDRGDAVEIKNSKMERIGIGIAAYSSSDAHMIKGHQSQEIEHIVGFSGRNDLIHANDLVVDDKN